MDSARSISTKSARINSSTTTTLWSATVRLLSLVVSVETPGTTWILTVQDKAGTPIRVFSKTLAAGDNIIALALTDDGGIDMDGGVDIVTSGTAGVVHVKATARRYDGL